MERQVTEVVPSIESGARDVSFERSFSEVSISFQVLNG
jgi:hypothetical protein